jgi:hypothetical protein
VNKHLASVSIKSKQGSFDFGCITLLKNQNPNDAVIQRMAHELPETMEPDGVTIPANMLYRFPTQEEIRNKRKRDNEARAQAKVAAAANLFAPPVMNNAARGGAARRKR